MRERRGLDLPPAFMRHNQQDPAWVAALPDLLDALAARWSLRLEAHFPGIGYNYVAPAWRVDGTPCVLKVSRDLAEADAEMKALRLWDGNGAARLLDADPTIGAQLMERLEPGTMLSEVAESDDDAATRIAAGVLLQLWRPAAEHDGLRSLASWCSAYERNREALSQGASGFPTALFLRADAVRRDLLASAGAPWVLHGDLHHFNVLFRAHDAQWLAIDPKGLSGDRAFDICQFFHNPQEMPPRVNARRLDLFCAELDLDRERAKDWCLVHAILNACWYYEEGTDWRRAAAYAESTLTF